MFHFGVADSANVLAEYVGGDVSVMNGLMTGAGQSQDSRVRGGHTESAPMAWALIACANYPVYRWQNHGEFNIIFNAMVG